MLEIKRVVEMSPAQWDIVICEGMRNPMNSWAKSDSYITHICDPDTMQEADFAFFMGEEDHKLAMKLAKAGSVHAKYRRMMPLWVTINAPLYWWKEFDTYKVATVANSCSTMHKLHAKEFTLDDFSYERLSCIDLDRGVKSPYTILNDVIRALNECRRAYLETGDKRYWYMMIQLLPSSYMQQRTVMFNYETLVGLYRDRRNHKLYEWYTFCDWVETLPYIELVIGEREEK